MMFLKSVYNHYNIIKQNCQERHKKMNGNGSLSIKKKIIKALDECTDIDLLLFVYKMLEYDKNEEQSRGNADCTQIP